MTLLVLLMSSSYSPCLVPHRMDSADRFFSSSLLRADKNLDELSSLGHFLKGSSATLGFNKVRDSCQIIQQYGHKQTVDGADEPDEEVCLTKITDAIKTLKVDFADLEKEIKVFFNGETPEEA